jgi:hypothetical protein
MVEGGRERQEKGGEMRAPAIAVKINRRERTESIDVSGWCWRGQDAQIWHDRQVP